MALLPVLAVVLAGVAATLACVLRGRREHPGTSAPWFALAAGLAIQTGWAAIRWRGGAAEAWSSPGPTLLLVANGAHLVAVPFVVVGLLGLPHPAADRFHRVQWATDGLVAALAFALVTWELLLPAAMTEGGTAVLYAEAVTAISSAAVATVAVHALARAQSGPGLSFRSLGPVAGGLLLKITGSAVAEVGSHLGLSGITALGLVGSALGLLMVVAGGLRPVDEAESPSTVRLREQVAVLAPLVPLVLAGLMVAAFTASGRAISPAGELIGLALLLALLAGSVLTRLEALRVTRTMEARVAERTLDLGTREKWFRALVQHASDVVTVLDDSGKIRYQTPSGRRILGYDTAQLVGLSFGRLVGPDDEARLADVLAACIDDPGVGRSMELSVWHQEGRWVEAEITATSLLDDPDVGGLVLTLRDVSEHRRLADQLTQQAYTDPLTGLANRTFFTMRVEETLVGARPASVAVLFIDLDGFKSVNDTQGHASGDRLLELVGRRLRSCVRPGDVVARLGGDEFGVLLEGPEVEQAATWVARRIWRQLANEFRLDDRPITLGASTGVAVNDQGDETAGQLLRNADLAMYRAKASERAMFVRYEEQMHDALLARVQVESELRRAVTDDQLAMVYQPVVDLRTGRVVGAEALLRWRHPERGLVEPAAFIEVAEEMGLVHEIGAWVLREACEQALGWQQFAVTDDAFRVGVNVSVRQLVPGWARIVRDVLAATGLPAEALTLEVTESVLLERTEESLALLQRLRELGVRLALDDFGTGYSSLSYLSKVPVDVLKIDRSFVEPVGRDAEGAEVARTIVRLGAALRLTTVAEGIETIGQRDALVEMGCDLGQGYLFARPMSAEALTALLAQHGQQPAEELTDALPVVGGSRPAAR